VRRRRRKKNPNKQNGGGASAKSFVALRLHRPLLFFFTFTNFHSFSHSLETEGLLWPLHAKRPVFNNNRLECQNDVNRFLFYGKIRWKKRVNNISFCLKNITASNADSSLLLVVIQPNFHTCV
jgi:hypothetical protein